MNLNEIINRYNNATEGIYSGIPFIKMPKMSKKLPGLVKGLYMCVTSNPGVGKTQFTKFITLRNLISYHDSLEDKNHFSAKILWFALEETETEFWIKFTSYEYFIRYQISLEYKKLAFPSPDDKYPLEVMRKFFALYDEIKSKYSKYIEVIDNISNPTGIYKECKKQLMKYGKFEQKKIIDNISKEETLVDGEFIYNNPNHIMIVVVDHINLISTENNLTLHQTLTLWSQEYCIRQLTKRMKFCVIAIHQQASEGAKKEFHRGELIVEKLYPTDTNLAVNTELGRDYQLIIGLFSPSKYYLKEFDNNDVYEQLVQKNNAKAFIRAFIIKDRHFGTNTLHQDFLFNGLTNTFLEL